MKDDSAMDNETTENSNVTAREWAQCIGGLLVLFSLLNLASLLFAVAFLFLALSCVASAFYVSYISKNGIRTETADSENA